MPLAPLFTETENKFNDRARLNVRKRETDYDKPRRACLLMHVDAVVAVTTSKGKHVSLL